MMIIIINKMWFSYWLSVGHNSPELQFEPPVARFNTRKVFSSIDSAGPEVQDMKYGLDTRSWKVFSL